MDAVKQDKISNLIGKIENFEHEGEEEIPLYDPSLESSEHDESI